MGDLPTDLIEQLPIPERIARYRARALEMADQAGATKDPNVQRSYLALATGWVTLANTLEREGALKAMAEQTLHKAREANES